MLTPGNISYLSHTAIMTFPFVAKFSSLIELYVLNDTAAVAYLFGDHRRSSLTREVVRL